MNPGIAALIERIRLLETELEMELAKRRTVRPGCAIREDAE